MFAFELALALGYADPDAMLDDMDPQLWEEWKIFGRLRPFGERRADLRNALLALAIDCVVARAAGGNPFLDPSALMPFDDLPESDVEGGWEDPSLTAAKLQMLAGG